MSRELSIKSEDAKSILEIANLDGEILVTFSSETSIKSHSMWLSREQVIEIIRFFSDQTLGIDFAQIMIEAAKSGKKVRFE